MFNYLSISLLVYSSFSLSFSPVVSDYEAICHPKWCMALKNGISPYEIAYGSTKWRMALKCGVWP